MKVGIIGGSPTLVEAVRRAILSTEAHEVVWIGRDVSEIERLRARQEPHVIVLEPPPKKPGRRQEMTSLVSTCPIVLVVGAEGDLSRTDEAMDAGAVDVAEAPVFDAKGQLAKASSLLRKLDTVAKLIGQEPGARARPAPPSGDAVPPLVAIGASTGGPEAIAQVLEKLPRDFHAAVAVVQHMEAEFIPDFARWLQTRTVLSIRLARQGDRFAQGTVLVAGSGDHLVLTPHRTLRYQAEPLDDPYRPSVDAFFVSLARHWPMRGVAALLTGMGKDGAAGMLQLRNAGWMTIAQDEQTSVVYGMPKAAVQLGAVSRVLPLGHIGAAIVAAPELFGSIRRERA